MNKNEIVVLFSGGTDSTLTAALMAEKYDKVHLITYDRLGFFSINNPSKNLQKLRKKFGENKFTHRVVKVDKLFNYVSYERYLKNFLKYRFFLLSTCGLCKLAMHVRTIIFCLDNNIANVCDGANQGMRLFPAQMEEVINETKNMYAASKINYTTPVFHLDGPEEVSFADRLHLEQILSDEKKEIEKQKRDTAGVRLYELGLMPSDNVKGTELDRKMQPRCFQFILFNSFVLWYYLYNRNYDQYKKATLEFYSDKIKVFTNLLEKYSKEEKRSKLYKLIEN